MRLSKVVGFAGISLGTMVAASATDLPAQSIRGVIVAAEGDAPPIGVHVVLLDTAGSRRASTLSDQDGRFMLRAPAPGLYRLRSERIGYASTMSEPLELKVGEVIRYTLRIATRPISLSGITVEGGTRCTLRPGEALATGRVWEEARKALSATAAAEADWGFHFEVEAFTRELEPERLRVLRDERRRRSGVGISSPYVSRPVEELVERGFVWRSEDDRHLEYQGPDAEVLLSDAFLDTHCMRLTAGREGLLGLTFEPVPGRQVPDVHGTLWLDRQSAALRHLEYRYTGQGLDIPLDRAGGRIEFERLPGGVWIVRHWWIRMPVMGGGQGRLGDMSFATRRPVRFREEGGEVTAVLTANGRSIEARARATLTGTVHDSTRAVPLPGATVFLSGTQYRATTDRTGAFRLADVPSGHYAVGFLHPRLDSLGVYPSPVEVQLNASRTASVELGLPSRDAVLRAGCPAAPDPQSGMIVGVLRGADTGRPLPGATVLADWRRPTLIKEYITGVVIAQREKRAETLSDEAGRYRVCDVPGQTPITIRVEIPGYRGEALTVKLNEREIRTLDIDLLETGPQP